MNTTHTKKQVVLIVLDGWGYREDPTNNAIAEAWTPFFDSLWSTYSHSLLKASGLAVGLPDGQIGNSEIGHMTIGAGTTIYTDLVRIDESIVNGSFFTNDAFMKLIEHIKQYNSAVHIIGLLSDGGVHSHQNHLYAFLELCKKNNIQKDKVVLHMFTDGRDTMPKTAVRYLSQLENKLQDVGVGVIGSVGGRYYGMDRAKNWDRISTVENILFECKGNVFNIDDHGSVSAFMEKQYIKDPSGKIDEYMEHYVCTDSVCSGYPISKNDGIFFFNFRGDRARQLTTQILKKKEELNLCYVSMAEYGDDLDTIVAFPPVPIKTSLTSELARVHLTQAHITESEKFPHVTYFFNGCTDKICEGEVHIKIESRTDIPTHDLAPEMKAKEIADAAIAEVEKGTDFVVVNFPNPDVVGHTGNIPAIITAVEYADTQCRRLVEAILAHGGVAFVTADHGNAELTINPETGDKHTAHTTSLVPAILTDTNIRLRGHGTIADITPTILELFGISKPASMTGQSLLH